MLIYTKKQYYFNGLDLVVAREQLGLSQYEFSEKAGWSQQQQSKLECMVGHVLTPEIQSGLEKVGIVLEFSH
jgi:transcriptional regulator with XRE-family HTH domain